MEFKKYDKSLPYSYVFGAFGTIELLNNRPNQCIGVIIDPSFVSNDAFSKIKSICESKKIPLIIDYKIIDKIRDKGNIYVIGVFKKHFSNLSNNKHIVLYDINDAGDIGTIIRSLRGFDFENLVLINCNIDLFEKHLIRATMGAFFSTNIKQYDSLDKYLLDYPNQNLINVTNEGEVISNIKKDDNLSLIFSNNKINHPKMKFYKVSKDISLENIVNIVLFNLY